MAYKKYYKTIQQSNEKYTVLANVFCQGTQHGFKHGCDNIDIMDSDGNVLYSKTFDKPTICHYINRTWECYEFQSVIKEAIRKISTELRNKNIDSEYITKEVL